MNALSENIIRMRGGKSSSVRLGINGWLISFGDLLTLLLCTFVAIISFAGMRNQPELRAKYIDSTQEVNNNQRLASSNGAEPIAGTQVANQVARDLAGGADQSAEQLLLLASDFSPDEPAGSAATKQKIGAALAGISSLELVRVESCATRDSGSNEQAWFWSMGRALEASSALLELGLPREKLQIRALGPDCALIRKDPGDEVSVAKISFVLKQTAAGKK